MNMKLVPVLGNVQCILDLTLLKSRNNVYSSRFRGRDLIRWQKAQPPGCPALPVAARKSLLTPKQYSAKTGDGRGPAHLLMFLLVHKDAVDPENPVSVPEPRPLCGAALLHHPHQVAVRVLLNPQEEAVALPFWFGQLTLSGAEGGGHFCDER